MFKERDHTSIRMLLSLFVSDICEKTALCLEALDETENELRSPNANVGHVFNSVQTALLHSSFVSLAFWPTDRKKEMRGKYLREGFSCQNSIEFFKARKFRNHIAHMDERLDDWWLSSKRRNIARKIIGGSNAVVGLDADDMFERLDPANGELFFRGDRYSLKEFWQHCSEIYLEAVRLSQFSWFDPEFERAFPINS